MERLEIKLNPEGLKFIDENRLLIERCMDLIESFETTDIKKLNYNERSCYYARLNYSIAQVMETIKENKDMIKNLISQKEYEGFISDVKNVIILCEEVVKQLENHKENYEKAISGR